MSDQASGASARLSTHVLDTAAGRPAAGVRVELFALDAEAPRLVVTAHTNADGRTDAPLLAGAAFAPGAYELRFHVGAYFGTREGFLDVVPVRFRVAEAAHGAGHVHVPLLVAPGGYTTYRGS